MIERDYLHNILKFCYCTSFNTYQPTILPKSNKKKTLKKKIPKKNPTKIMIKNCIKICSEVFLENSLCSMYLKTLWITQAICDKNVRLKRLILFIMMYFGLFKKIKRGFQFRVFLHLLDKTHIDKKRLVRTLVSQRPL